MRKAVLILDWACIVGAVVVPLLVIAAAIAGIESLGAYIIRGTVVEAMMLYFAIKAIADIRRGGHDDESSNVGL